MVLFILLIVYIPSLSVQQGVRKYVMTELCAAQDSLSIQAHGAVLSWDGEAEADTEVREPGSETIDCNITFKVQPKDFGFLEIWSGLYFRGGFVVTPQGQNGTRRDVENCEGAYMQLYDPPTRATPTWTFCSRVAVPENYESESQELMLRVVANFTRANRTENATVNEAENLMIFFEIDFTTFSPDCDDGQYSELMKCRHSRRCIHENTRCDGLASINCWSPDHVDISDQLPGPPGYCGPWYLPLWIALGILGGLLLAGLLYWCFWRPGWLPWRCARLRNCRGCGRCCKRGKCGKFNSTARCFRCCRMGPENSYNRVSKTGQSGLYNSGYNQALHSGKSGGTSWMRFCSGDGFHLAEARY